MKIKNILFSICLIYSISILTAHSEEFELRSPNEKLKLIISVEGDVRWSVFFKDLLLLKPSRISMELDMGDIPFDDPVILGNEMTFIDEEIESIVAVKSKMVRDNCNQLTLDFEGNYSLIFRVYDNGCAYRFATNLKDDIKVYDEEVNFEFAGNYKVYFPELESFVSHYESPYQYVDISSLSSGQFSSLPVLVEAEDGIKIGITESALYDYPGMFLEKDWGNSFSGIFPEVVLEVESNNDRDEKIADEAGYIASTNGARSFPWRILMISDEDEKLVENQLVFLLSDPLKLEETGWIKPGKVAWDWWNSLNVYGVDFVSGINTDTYKYYIDFAAEYGLEYIILDEGWSASTTNIIEPSPDVDLTELIKYGNAKNVGLILWVLWKPLNENMIEVLDKYAGWGVKGIKVDFMQRSDQWMVNYYERVLHEAGKRKLLVDFHGAFKPSGLMRPYPNYMTCEGVMGLEASKWSDAVTPEHDLTLPFTRMLAGPMDYTPGAMVNAHPKNFVARFERPMSQGTRSHQAAMYVIYESPLQMLCDSPSNYLADKEYIKFISKIPTTWDETKVLDALVSDYILLARKKDNSWYIGAMTDSTPRELDLDLSFLEEGAYSVDFIQDGINADRYASDYKILNKKITNTDNLTIRMAGGGGWVAVITPER